MIDGWVAGVDVSHHQRPDRCDWHRAREAGIDFAFVRISVGADVVDEAAAKHIKGIRAAGIPFGVYHAARPDYRFDVYEIADGREAGRIEAEHTLRCYEAAGLCGEPMAIDHEVVSEKSTAEQRGDYVLGLAEVIVAELGPQLVYTGDDYWRAQIPRGTEVVLRSRGWALWLADHTTAAEPRTKEVIHGWPWSIWQWSGGKKTAFAKPVPGLPSPVDMNRYRGSLAELRGLWSRTVMGGRW